MSTRDQRIWRSNDGTKTVLLDTICGYECPRLGAAYPHDELILWIYGGAFMIRGQEDVTSLRAILDKRFT